MIIDTGMGTYVHFDSVARIVALDGATPEDVALLRQVEHPAELVSVIYATGGTIYGCAKAPWDVVDATAGLIHGTVLDLGRGGLLDMRQVGAFSPIDAIGRRDRALLCWAPWAISVVVVAGAHKMVPSDRHAFALALAYDATLAAYERNVRAKANVEAPPRA